MEKVPIEWVRVSKSTVGKWNTRGMEPASAFSGGVVESLIE